MRPPLLILKHSYGALGRFTAQLYLRKQTARRLSQSFIATGVFPQCWQESLTKRQHLNTRKRFFCIYKQLWGGVFRWPEELWSDEMCSDPKNAKYNAWCSCGVPWSFESFTTKGYFRKRMIRGHFRAYYVRHDCFWTNLLLLYWIYNNKSLRVLLHRWEIPWEICFCDYV